MLEAFLDIFSTTCIGMVGLVAPVLGIYLLFDFTSSLLVKDK